MRKTQMAPNKMRKVLIKDMNDVLICTLCNGYLIDATSLTECHHIFCRGCILKYFENCKAACPSCNFVYKKKNQVYFKADPQIQSIVYKVVPGLYSKEMQRREDFYRSTGVRASSSCSDDSVLERERDMINDEEISSYVGDKTQFFGPEDSISLSLEYYQYHLDTTPLTKQNHSGSDQDNSGSVLNNNNSDTVSDKHKVKSDKDIIESNNKTDKRYLQCPAAVSMKHLQKFIRMKFALAQHHKVDIIYEGEVLPVHFSLMDVAYTFKWMRSKPMRFFYRIFTPLKIQPIKIVTTATKQLQVVSPTTKNESFNPPPPPPPLPKPEIKNEEKEEEREEKERLLAHLQLKSKTKVQNHENTSVPEKRAQSPQVQDCVFDYEEQDKEEIKRFAEIRDREWALQKKLDESRERERDEDYHHFSKKRKKNKHSKNDSTYKKRKLHAEITSKEEELKLKVKLSQHNGHKHKHHKSSSQQNPPTEMSSKEKLLQMRQVRHKHVSSEDKNIQTVPSVSASKETSTETTNDEEKKEITEKPIEKPEENKTTNGIKSNEEVKKINEVNIKTLRSDFPTKTTLNKEWTTRVPTVQIERNEQTEQQAKKTFLKSYQAYAEKYQKSQQNNKTESAKKPSIVPLNRPPTTLDRKIASLQQRCTIEPKLPPQKLENKPLEKKITHEKPKTPPQYPPGFTVSKIESGVKRKNEEDSTQDKRPSLEITLINPTTTETKPPPTPTPAKRPPPDTIPLVRIKKTFNFNKSGISIIPKTPQTTTKCDNIGALDLSAKHPSGDATPTPSTSSKPVNGFASPTPPSKEGKNVNMSNLQMLSKVAAEHPTINKTPKPRPQIPNLQTLRIPTPNQRIPPSLKMIDKSQFRLMNPQIRNLRPNQNQSIRNIPNPSLVVKQQQNRLNSMNPIRENNNGEKETTKVVTPTESLKTPETKSTEVDKIST